jgi:hypothetical protein
MKKNIKTVALFAALSLAAVSCQKTDEFLPINGNEQLAETFQVMYSINGEVFQTTMSESEWDAFLERMMALAREGYEVTFSKNRSSLTSQSKEKVTFVTTSEQEANEWSNNMANQGYEVTISYNHKTGEYTCIATR